MADKGLIEKSTLDAIAAAIRTKNGKTTKYAPSAMAAAIKAITTNAQIATGTFSVSNTSTTSKAVTHGLGKKPTFAILIRTTTSTPSVPAAVGGAFEILGANAASGGFTIGVSGGIGSLANEFTINSTQVIFASKEGSASAYLAGTYRYIIGV